MTEDSDVAVIEKRVRPLFEVKSAAQQDFEACMQARRQLSRLKCAAAGRLNKRLADLHAKWISEYDRELQQEFDRLSKQSKLSSEEKARINKISEILSDQH